MRRDLKIEKMEQESLPLAERMMEKEALLLAEQMIETQCTIMELEKEFCIPRTTIHRRLTKTLALVDLDMWDECQHILKAHAADALNRARRARWMKRA